MTPDQLARPVTLAAGEVLVTNLVAPVVLPLGHHARAAPCLICGQPIGWHPADQVCLWPVDGDACTCGRVDVVAFLVHAGHQLPGVRKLTRLAHDRLAAGHPGEQVRL